MKAVVLNASSYIKDNGTGLQKSCLEYVLGRGSKDKVREELSGYQNSDGGFSNGLEIEYQGPVSSPFSTAAALGYIFRFDLADTELLEKALRYLRKNQKQDGSFDDESGMLAYPHPEYMGPGIYVDFKTGMILKWLRRLKIDEEGLINRAQQFLLDNFDRISEGRDLWSAAAYASAFADQRQLPEYPRIMEWCMSILAPEPDVFGWQQAMGMIEDDMDIPEQVLPNTLKMISERQQSDGGWPHQFGTYNRVWAAIFIVRFLLNSKLAED